MARIAQSYSETSIREERWEYKATLKLREIPFHGMISESL